MADRKVRRDDIGKATCHRLLREGAFSKARVEDDAAMAARKALKNLLKQIANNAAKDLALTKRKTVTDEIVKRAVECHCFGISEGDLIRGHVGTQRGLPEAGVVRVVKKALPSKTNISEDGKEALVAAGEAYLRSLGQRAGMMTLAAKRKTLSENDVKSAAKTLSR
jgi:histone H3/H4